MSPARAATPKQVNAAGFTERGLGEPGADQPERPDPDGVRAADPVGVVVGVVDADLQGQRDHQRGRAATRRRARAVAAPVPTRTGAMAGREGARPRTGDPLGQGGHGYLGGRPGLVVLGWACGAQRAGAGEPGGRERAPVDGGTLSGTVTDGTDPLAGATVALGSRTTITDGSGNYSFSVPSGTYPSLTASKDGFDSASAADIEVPDGGSATRDFTLGAAATSGCFTDDAKTDFQRGVPINCDLTTSPGDVLLANPTTVDQQNTNVTNSGFGFNSTNWAGQTFTPAVTGVATRIDLDLFCSGCTGTTPSLTVSIRATTGNPAVPTGADLATATIPGFNSGAGGFFSADFATPATLTAGTRYAVVLRPVSNPSAGLYAYVVSSGNAYASGQRVTSANSGSTWTADTTSGGRDLGFKVWVNSGFASTGTLVSSVKDANPARAATWSGRRSRSPPRPPRAQTSSSRSPRATTATAHSTTSGPTARRAPSSPRAAPT